MSSKPVDRDKQGVPAEPPPVRESAAAASQETRAPIDRAGSSLSVRLNLWYASFFILASLALFLLAYFVLATSIQQKEKEVIRARLEEYRAWYEGGGLAGLSEKF